LRRYLQVIVARGFRRLQAKLANTVQAAQAAAHGQIAQALALQSMMAKTGSNPVAQILQHLGDFYEWRDYPDGGVWDQASGYGYFYHAHPGPSFEGEHGHFHLFWGPARDRREALIGLSMDRFGLLSGAFSANAWHCGLASDGDLAARYRDFRIDLAFPCFAANQWLGAVVRGLAAPLTALHVRSLDILADSRVAEDRGRAVVAAQRIDLAAQMGRPMRLSLKPVKR
jgi:hypothetical protein